MSDSHVPPLAVPPSPPALPAAYPAPPQTNGMAIASLVLGIVSLACSQCITAIPGVIFGHIALKQIRESHGTQGGRGLAIGGLVTGYVSLGIVVIVYAIIALVVFLGVAVSASA